MRAVLRILGLLATTALTGCFSQPLAPFEYPPELQRLLTIPSRPLQLVVTTPESTRSVGHQYLFLIVPVTWVSVPHLEREANTLVASAAARRGWKVQPRQLDDSGVLSTPAESAPVLRVTITELSLSGYDLLFVRRPYASVEVQGTFQRGAAPARRCEVSHQTGSMERFAFGPELSRTLEAALRTSFEELLRCLGV